MSASGDDNLQEKRLGAYLHSQFNFTEQVVQKIKINVGIIKYCSIVEQKCRKRCPRSGLGSMRAR
jgi:hypothetical protein